MKVKELIAELQKLDQERGIWVFYDGGYSIFPPVPDERAGGLIGSKKGVQEGDYIINAG